MQSNNKIVTIFIMVLFFSISLTSALSGVQERTSREEVEALLKEYGQGPPARPIPDYLKPVLKPVEEPVTIKLLWGMGNEALPIRKWAPLFTNLTGINVEITTVPHTLIHDVAMKEFRADGSQYDAIEYVYPNLPEYVVDGYVGSIEDYIDKYNVTWLYDDYPPTIKELYCMWTEKIYGIEYNKTYGIAFDGDIHSYYYRKDLFENSTINAEFESKYGYKLAPPETWDQYKDVAEFFYDTDYVPYGCSEVAKRGRCYLWWCNRFFGMDGKWFYPDGRPAINSQAGIDALENFRDCIKYAPPVVLTYEIEEHEAAWYTGMIAEFVQWPDAWKDAELERDTVLDWSKVGVTLTPGKHPCMATGWAAAFPSKAKHTEEAFRFLVFVTSPYCSTWSVCNPECGIDPYLIDGHFKNPEVQEILAPEFLGVLEECFASGMPDLRIPHSHEFLDYLDMMCYKCLTGEIEPKEALDKVADYWAELLIEYCGSPILPEEYRALLEPPTVSG